MLKLVEFQKYDFVHYLQLADSPTHMPLSYLEDLSLYLILPLEFFQNTSGNQWLCGCLLTQNELSLVTVIFI
jgi:hypothetical protein